MKEYSFTKSIEAFQKARTVLAGGVSSVARTGFAPNPPFFDRGKGSHVWDVDGNEYVDYALGYGPLLLGHCHPELTEAVVETIRNRSTTFGICHDLEYQAAEKIVKHMPTVDLVRFTNSGSEAVMVALRLARGFMGKEKILRFEGAYHGWTDVIHWNTRSPMGSNGLRTNPRLVPGTAGIPDAIGSTLVISPWNDPENVEKIVKRHAHELAAIITEPIQCNLGATMPKPGYLKFLRDLCDKYDMLLIFDEVITAFRLGLTGAQGYFGVNADITTMAKAIGAGYPVGAVGGRKEIMDVLGAHQVSHAGTYNGNVLATAAVKASLTILERPGVYEKLFALGDRLRNGMARAAHDAGLPAVGQGVGPVVQIWFENQPITDYRDAMTRPGMALYPRFVQAMNKRGVMSNPAQFGVWYVSTEHTEADIDFTINAAKEAFKEMKG